MIYEQNIYWIKTNYIKEKFWHEINWMSGIREESNHAVKLGTGRNLFEEIEFKIDTNRMEKLKNYFNLIRKDLKNANLDFDAVVYLHNEIVLIDNEKRDNRSYGFVRVIIKMEGTPIYTEDIPVYTSALFGIEEIVNHNVMDGCIKYNHIGKRVKKKLFKNMPHILSAKAAGFFVHEIIGHLLESDYYNYYKDGYSDIKIVPYLRVTDSVQGFQQVVGFNEYDDMGNKVKPVLLIKNGRINNIISANKKDSFNNKAYGFARRATFKDSIMPRMRNTYIEPHKDMNKQDILNQYEEAIFVEETNLGVVDYHSGEFKLYGNGYIVKNGVLHNFIGDLCIYGNIKKDISMIDYIGNDFKIYGGYCGKMGQGVHVGCGGPTISLLEMTSEGIIYERR